MGIRIDEINVEEIGPISKLQLTLGSLNLIYGRNEQGKTFLVEFLIRSLFNNRSGWSLRPSGCRGKVILSGVREKPLGFTPYSKKKLEDYLAENEPGMPPQISHLLVVKGAELGFEDDNRTGINNKVLKNFLSGQGILDVIQGRMSKTVMDARIDGGQIIGHRRGEIKIRSDLARRQNALNQLFKDIDKTYSDGERRTLENDINNLGEKITDQVGAKQYLAYQIDQQIRDLQSQLDLLPQNELDELNDDFQKLKDGQSRIDRYERQVDELSKKSANFEWLEQAITVYEQRGRQGKVTGGKLYPFLIFFLLFLAILFSLVGIPAGTILLIVGVAILSWLYWRKLKSAMAHATDVDEIKKLEIEFQHRFGCSLTGLPLMQKEKKTMEEAHYAVYTQRQNLQEELDMVDVLEKKIAARLERLSSESNKLESWGETFQALIRKREQKLKEQHDLQLKLVELAIDPDQYQAEPGSVDYHPRDLERLKQEQTRLTDSLKEKTNELENLKQRICQVTSDDISMAWDSLIQNLQREWEETAVAYRRITAKVLAGILVNKALGSIRAQEEQKIREKLASPLVGRPIQRITRRYTGVRYDDGSLLVEDPYGEFKINDLSTGTREQLLLALRLGFAAQLLGQDRLFLLLDDAFQHADWQRRHWLMEQIAGLVQDGWQIIYFTMDDHIRKLFNEAGRRLFADSYRSYDLSAV